MTDEKKSYKDTLNLPKTEFPMRGNLPVKEPERLARWKEQVPLSKIEEPHLIHGAFPILTLPLR